ncbi:hypothetical protein CLOP_g20674 [Closterium sp. NIES-67]|nr:hypothetical protein CLOP_g20674 [Closterium sp. NIES-67]
MCHVAAILAVRIPLAEFSASAAKPRRKLPAHCAPSTFRHLQRLHANNLTGPSVKESHPLVFPSPPEARRRRGATAQQAAAGRAELSRGWHGSSEDARGGSGDGVMAGVVDFRLLEQRFQATGQLAEGAATSLQGGETVGMGDGGSGRGGGGAACVAAVPGSSIVRVEGVEGLDCPVFTVQGREGFFFLPGALTVQQQAELIGEALCESIEPPNRTNHNAALGAIHGLWPAFAVSCAAYDPRRDTATPAAAAAAAAAGGAESGNDNNDYTSSNEEGNGSSGCGDVGIEGGGATRPMRSYDPSLPSRPFPAFLAHLASRLAAPAMPSPHAAFSAEAAIVNFYHPGDMLGGHVDDMEADWSKPIVSISLGCKAVFLLGGRSREEAPMAVVVRSGDVLLMAGPCRECFHGVPRIFSDPREADIPPALLAPLSSGGLLPAAMRSLLPALRINVNVRQVY